MDIIIIILSITMPIFLGYFFKHLKIFSDNETITLRKFVVKVTVPFIIFRNLYHADISTLKQIYPAGIAFILMTVLFAVSAYFVGKMLTSDIKKQNGFIFSVFIGNYGYLGWGVMNSFYGEPGFTRAVLFTFLFWPVFLGSGFSLMYLQNKSSIGRKREIIKLIITKSWVPILATALGIIMSVSGIKISPIFDEFINKFANITIPLILFTVGLNFKFKMDIKSFKIVFAGAIHRLILGFGIGYLTYYLVNYMMDVDPITAKVIILEGAMPTAAMATLFSEYIDLDKDIQAGIITISTILSLITIPLLYFFIT